MAKPSTLDEPAGMDKADLKRHLRMAREEPVTCAFAIGRDGKAILQLDRRKPGRSLEKDLKEAAPDSKNHRWGTALIDPESPKTVCFTVNKGGGGLAKKLIVALKGTGFNKVRIQLDDGSEVEAHEERDEADEEAGKEAAAPAGAAAGAAADGAEARGAPEGHGAAEAMGAAAASSAGGAAPETVPAQAGTAPPRAAVQPDAAALAKDLTGLVKRMLGVIAKDATQKSALTELATDAQASLKRGDLEQASAGIDIFREAVDDCEAAVAGATAGKSLPNGAASPHAAPAAQAEHPAPHSAEKRPNGEAAHEPDLRREAEEVLATLTRAVKQAVPLLNNVPVLGEMIKTVVPAVQAAIKAGQIEQARHSMKDFLEAVAKGHAGARAGAEAAGPALGGPAGHEVGGAGEKDHHEHAAKHAPAIEKASQVWGATRDKVMAEVQKLEKAVTSALDGHGMMENLTKTLRTKVEGTLQHLDDRLMHALAAVNKAPDAAERAKHVEQAHKLVQHYQTHVSADKTIKMLDTNPFHPLAIEKTVMASLAALQKSIH